MENHKDLFNQIEEKEKEWQRQVQYLKSKITGFDPDVRDRLQNQIDILSIKLKEIELHTNQLKRINDETKNGLSEKLVHTWIELFTEIDNVMLKLMK